MQTRYEQRRLVASLLRRLPPGEELALASQDNVLDNATRRCGVDRVEHRLCDVDGNRLERKADDSATRRAPNHHGNDVDGSETWRRMFRPTRQEVDGLLMRAATKYLEHANSRDTVDLLDEIETAGENFG